MLFKT